MVYTTVSLILATYNVAPAASGFVVQVQSVLTTVLPIAAGLIALVVGFRLFRYVFGTLGEMDDEPSDPYAEYSGWWD